MDLPPLIDGTRLALPPQARQVTIIGANGSGKTRFTDYIIGQMPQEALRLSALDAIYNNVKPDRAASALPCSIESRYNEAVKKPAFLHNSPQNLFECLITLLLNEEIAALVEYKVTRDDSDKGAATLPPTKLDEVIRRWQQAFPDSHIKRQGARLMFSRDGTGDIYPQRRLSDGEKAVLYHIGAALYAPKGGTIFVDNPAMFLHPTMVRRLWDSVEAMRPDCRFVYITHDVDFAASRSENAIVWVRAYDPALQRWDYSLLPKAAGLSEEIYMAIIGDRKPVLFIEGDATHSIDAKLYPLVFQDFTVKSLGSCNKVIEVTRSFNDLKSFHHLQSSGIVDRDRRDEKEVEYLRSKQIFVPNVAEIENILMLEGVVRAVARHCHRDDDKVFAAVKRSIIGQFKQDVRKQALMHTRHRVKRIVEMRIDGRFVNITALEDHMQNLVNEINPRGMYERFCRDFNSYIRADDYPSVLRVYNQKSMVPGSNVAALCGLSGSKDSYVQTILTILKENLPEAPRLRQAITDCFGINRRE